MCVGTGRRAIIHSVHPTGNDEDWCYMDSCVNRRRYLTQDCHITLCVECVKSPLDEQLALYFLAYALVLNRKTLYCADYDVCDRMCVH